jgi:hypothetical protein
MQSDFLDAHNRHLKDAEHLFTANRWANADHLYGLATECGLKQLMLAFGMPFDTNRDIPQERADRQHANGIWNRYESYRRGHLQGARYALPTTSNPFVNWDVSQRYANQSHFDRTRTEPHRTATKQVQTLISKAQREGLL